MIGSVDAHLLGLLLSGSVPGIVLGSRCAAHVPDRVLRFALAITLLMVGCRLVFWQGPAAAEMPLSTVMVRRPRATLRSLGRCDLFRGFPVSSRTSLGGVVNVVEMA